MGYDLKVLYNNVFNLKVVQFQNFQNFQNKPTQVSDSEF